MKIVTRICTSVDGYVTTPDGRPAQLADPGFDPVSYGFAEFHETVDAVVMGRTTFEPALAAARWPWGDLPVFVLGSHRPSGTPEHVTMESDPTLLLDTMNTRGDLGNVHLVGGPRTIQTFASLGVLDELGLILIPFLFGGGQQLNAPLGADLKLSLKGERALPTGAVEIVYDLAPAA